MNDALTRTAEQELQGLERRMGTVSAETVAYWEMRREYSQLSPEAILVWRARKAVTAAASLCRHEWHLFIGDARVCDCGLAKRVLVL